MRAVCRRLVVNVAGWTLLVACAPDVNRVREAVVSARTAGAEVYAPAELGRAQALLGQFEAAPGDPERTTLRAALQAAQAANTRALQRRSAVRQREEILRADKARAVETLSAQRAQALAQVQQARTGAGAGWPAGLGKVAVEDLAARLQRGDNLLVVDVRPAAAFAQGHLQGALSAPAASLAYRRLPAQLDVVLYSDDAHADSLAEASRAAWTQVPGRVSALHGGLDLWKARGLPWASATGTAGACGLVDVPGLVALRKGSAVTPLLIDLRPAASFAAGHIAGAHSVPLDALETSELPAAAELVAYAADDANGARGAQRLAERTRRNVRYLGGGLRAWVQAGQPLERAVVARVDSERGKR